MNKNVLLVNDMPGYGKVALGAMIPILSAMGHYVHNLPTCLVSNTLDYGKFEIMDTTEYIRRSIRVWKALGFTFDCLCTGFLLTLEQADIIREYVKENRSKDFLVISDPIMGDDGKLYNGVDSGRIGIMQKLIEIADIVIPNVTEAGFLTDFHPGATTVAESDIRTLVDGVRQLGPKSVVITSVCVKETGKNLVAGYDARTKEYFLLPYDEIPGHFPGTGDIFSAVMAGKLLNGYPLSESVRMAMNAVRFLIGKSQYNRDKFRGLLLEKFVMHIDEISQMND